MGFSGWFDGKALGDSWNGYETLVQVCVRAQLTNRQAEVTLLLCRGREYGEVQKVLGIPWREVWRSVKRANERLDSTFPRLQELIELLEATDSPAMVERWRRHPQLYRIARLYYEASEARNCYQAYQGPRRGDGKSPQFAIDSTSRRVFTPGAHPQLVTARDLNGGRFSGAELTPLDLLPALLDELAVMEEPLLACAS